MRLYLKLFVAAFLFVVAAQLPGRESISELMFEARVVAVMRFGTPADFERLLDDTQRRLATERGELDGYLRDKYFRELVLQRIAVAEVLDGPLSEADVIRIKDECAREAFGPPQTTADEPQPPPAPPALASLAPRR